MFQHYSLIIFLAFAALFSKVVSTEARIDHPQIVRQSGARRCRVNVCFAIDGSESVSSSDFRNSRTFVLAVVNRLSNLNNVQVGVAGVQFGLVSLPISPFTNNTRRFRQLVRKSVFEEAEFTRVSGGMVYCFGQLRSPPVLLPNANIVIIGSGEAELGIDPEVVAGLFREAGGRIFGIGVDAASTRNLAELLGSSRNVSTLGGRRMLNQLVNRLVPSQCRD